MSESTKIKIEPLYLLKVISGLIVLIALVVIAQSIPFVNDKFIHDAIIIILVLIALIFIPFIRFFYKHSDELQKLLHQNACVTSLSLVISISFIVGILQSSNIIPLFSQFWTMGLSICVWGLFLMLSDRNFK
jgi:hypothetical protein